MSILVRRASEADAEAISRLNADVLAVHAAALPGWFKPPSACTLPPEAAAELIEDPDSLVFLAELDSEPAGYAYAEVIRRPEEPWREAYEMVYLHHISVSPACRRKGVGEALIGAWRPPPASSASRCSRSMSGASTRTPVASSGATASRPITRSSGIASRLARFLLPCYAPPMQRLTSHSPGDAGHVSAVSRQRELLILCARIGFNP
jgi:GNAT superfamily N-acetyltransferase